MATCEGKGKLTLSCGARTLLTVYENFSCSTNFASLPLQYWLSPAFLSILRPEGRVIQGLWKKKILVIIFVVSSSSSAPCISVGTDGADPVKFARQTSSLTFQARQTGEILQESEVWMVGMK